MIVVCAFSANQPNEIQLAVGGNAGTVQVVTAARLLREEAERLLMSGAPEPEGRGEVGDVGPFQDVGAEDVVVTVAWTDGPPELDYRHAKAATADQLLTSAIALDEYVRFGVWNSRFKAEMAAQQEQQNALALQHHANQRASDAIVRAARLPTLGRA